MLLGAAALKLFLCLFVRHVFAFRPQEKEMEKQKILYQQARLHARGAAEMVLQMISASKGKNDPAGKRLPACNHLNVWRHNSGRI